MVLTYFLLFLSNLIFTEIKFDISTLFFEVSFSFFTKSRSLSNSRPPRNFQKSNPDPPGKFFELIPGGCPGVMYPVAELELTETLSVKKGSALNCGVFWNCSAGCSNATGSFSKWNSTTPLSNNVPYLVPCLLSSWFLLMFQQSFTVLAPIAFQFA